MNSPLVTSALPDSVEIPLVVTALSVTVPTLHSCEFCSFTCTSVAQFNIHKRKHKNEISVTTVVVVTPIPGGIVRHATDLHLGDATLGLGDAAAAPPARLKKHVRFLVQEGITTALQTIPSQAEDSSLQELVTDLEEDATAQDPPPPTEAHARAQPVLELGGKKQKPLHSDAAPDWVKKFALEKNIKNDLGPTSLTENNGGDTRAPLMGAAIPVTATLSVEEAREASVLPHCALAGLPSSRSGSARHRVVQADSAVEVIPTLGSAQGNSEKPDWLLKFAAQTAVKISEA